MDVQAILAASLEIETENHTPEVITDGASLELETFETVEGDGDLEVAETTLHKMIQVEQHMQQTEEFIKTELANGGLTKQSAEAVTMALNFSASEFGGMDTFTPGEAEIELEGFEQAGGRLGQTEMLKDKVMKGLKNAGSAVLAFLERLVLSFAKWAQDKFGGHAKREKSIAKFNEMIKKLQGEAKKDKVTFGKSSYAVDASGKSEANGTLLLKAIAKIAKDKKLLGKLKECVSAVEGKTWGTTIGIKSNAEAVKEKTEEFGTLLGELFGKSKTLTDADKKLFGVKGFESYYASEEVEAGFQFVVLMPAAGSDLAVQFKRVRVKGFKQEHKEFDALPLGNISAPIKQAEKILAEGKAVLEGSKAFETELEKVNKVVKDLAKELKSAETESGEDLKRIKSALDNLRDVSLVVTKVYRDVYGLTLDVADAQINYAVACAKNIGKKKEAK